MSPKVLTIILAVVFIYVECRGNINMGSTYGAHLIYHETHEKYGIPFTYRNEDVLVKGTGNELIHGVIVHDLKGDGMSYVKSGGINWRNVTIRLESGVRGNGYKFIVDVYAL